ncbi:HEAT repeat domain-containing protein [Clostridium magnum]|uniref:PBS lyase HEAT-like repeat protein n=1 Tax=Clostridium magnum DSM 2767 TaxID=1121326 RepID=A0A161XGL5_9CLOT|nr:HEAT repeat domain-containing protein [Clostridium magnum]KZL93756.1 PBS lyase HEAT-like repeat protein [Clostridium magnum DSM 2767]SHI09315.1 HEAT repeat-containing protein [Clostridium magnum DSM 2767]
MININWSDIISYSDEDITYFLFLEGKSIESLCRIRNLNKETIQKHVLDGKIKYGILAKSNDEEELFQVISKSGKQDKIEALRYLNDLNKSKLVQFIRDNYADMKTKDKENAVWILGEIGDKTVLDILIKASVHNHVNVRRMAVSAVGKIGEKDMEKIAIRALEDQNPQVVMYAIKALIKIKSENAMEKIKEVYKKTEKDYIKRTAEEYFSEVGEV